MDLSWAYFKMSEVDLDVPLFKFNSLALNIS